MSGRYYSTYLQIFFLTCWYARLVWLYLRTSLSLAVILSQTMISITLTRYSSLMLPLPSLRFMWQLLHYIVCRRHSLLTLVPSLNNIENILHAREREITWSLSTRNSTRLTDQRDSSVRLVVARLLSMSAIFA